MGLWGEVPPNWSLHRPRRPAPADSDPGVPGAAPPGAGIWACLPPGWGDAPRILGCEDQRVTGPCRLLPQIEVKLSVKFTSREFSLKRMPSRKQTGVFGVKIAVVTKCVSGGLGSRVSCPPPPPRGVSRG